MKRIARWTMLAFTMVAFICAPAYSQENADNSEKWEFLVIPYLWASAIEGDVTVKGVSSEVDASFSDILDNLDFATQLHLEAARGRWGLFLDPTYIKLSADGDVPTIVGDVDVDVDTEEWLVEFGGFYRLYEGTCSKKEMPLWFDVMAGGRYFYVDNEIDIDGPLGFVDINVDDSQDWVDPIVGARIQGYLTKKLVVSLRGDVGGFDMGNTSDFAWNVVASVGYELSERMTLLFCYRFLDVDYDDGSGNDRFEYDVQMDGPAIALSIKF
jgi:hypothetical protein